ncbi:hypothetical protein [Erysipelothrix tonsillarum]
MKRKEDKNKYLRTIIFVMFGNIPKKKGYSAINQEHDVPGLSKE